MTTPTPATAYSVRQAVQESLSILYRASGDGAKRKPTVAELNRIVDLLEAASEKLSQANVISA